MTNIQQSTAWILAIGPCRTSINWCKLSTSVWNIIWWIIMLNTLSIDTFFWLSNFSSHSFHFVFCQWLPFAFTFLFHLLFTSLALQFWVVLDVHVLNTLLVLIISWQHFSCQLNIISSFSNSFILDFCQIFCATFVTFCVDVPTWAWNIWLHYHLCYSRGA